MKDEELITIWKKSSDMNQIKVNMPLLVAELRHSKEVLDRKIGRRDQREIIACYIGAIGFALLAWHIPFFWTKVACVMVIGWFGYVIYRLKNTSKDSEPDSSLTLLEQLEQRKKYLQKQAKLLDSVLYWYILPPFIMNVIFVFGIGDPTSWDSWLASVMPETLRDKIMMLSFVFVLYSYILWTNRKAARTHYPPLIKDIERVQDELRKDK